MSEESTNATAATGQTSTSASAATTFEVAGEPGVYWCSRHRKTKTRLRCGRCETPICPKCTVYGPTGARCRDCASHRGSHMYQIAPPQYAAAIATALLLGVALGAFASFIGLFALFYAPLAGTLMGKAVAFVTKNKRGTPLAVIASVGLVLGVLWPALRSLLALLAIAQMPAAAPAPPTLFFFAGSPLFIIAVYLALAVPSAWWWLK